jgi:hypothetical protein
VVVDVHPVEPLPLVPGDDEHRVQELTYFENVKDPEQHRHLLAITILDLNV